MDERVRKCAHILQDSVLIAKLSVGDMMSQDAVYHAKCLSMLYRKANQENLSDVKGSEEKMLHGIALAELIAYIEDCRAETDVAPVFRLADLSKMYSERLNQLGAESSNRVHFNSSQF